MPTPGPDPYRELFERSADAILIIEDERFVDCNQATVDLLRYPNKEDLLRTHPSELSPPTQPDGQSSFEKANAMMALALERGSHRFEWDHVRFDGEVFPVEVLLTAVPRDAKQVLHVVWRDISDRKRLEEQLRHAQKMEIIGQLAGGVAHDFNNLLVAIMGNGELLQKKLADRPELALYVDEMVKAGQRGATLVRQLLLFSRPQDGLMETIDLVPVLGEVHRMLERLIGEDTLLVVESCREPLPIRGTRGHMEQVIVNLVTNARDAMPRGGTITVGIRRVTISGDSIGAVDDLVPGPHALLSVTDAGEGMSQTVLAHAIDPFFTTKPVGRGTGLGLSTVYGIAKQSGGGLRIDSVLGRGTTVKVYLPLRDDEPLSQDAPRVARQSRGGSERVLVAEDDAIVAGVVVRVLEAQGYTVQLASDGADALDRFLATPDGFDLLLSDVIMPRMSGPDLVREIRARGGGGLGVLLMSGYTRDNLSEAADLGEVDLLEKPFSASELVARVRDSLDRRG
ncbi:MAG: response regulator [Myxococcales bacterium]|nr:response regulator [Myxococcales bacterium]